MKIDSLLKELQEREKALRILINRSGLVCGPLDSDYNHSLKNYQIEKSQFWGRTAFRCLCAAVEARLFTFRAMALELSKLSKAQFEDEEMAILTERKITFDKAGNKTVRRKFLPLSDSIKETFRLFGKSMGVTVVVDYSTKGYQDFCEVFETRNRLMHPKNTFDIEIAKEETDTADRGVHWFNLAYTEVFKQCHDHVSKSIEAATKPK
jgi:hypothetical protein